MTVITNTIFNNAYAILNNKLYHQCAIPNDYLDKFDWTDAVVSAVMQAIAAVTKR